MYIYVNLANHFMIFKIFTLHPTIFTSFFTESLVAKAYKKNIFDYQTINWRDDYGKGKYKQIDDKPFAGGDGMVLQCQPIYEALKDNNSLSEVFNTQTHDTIVEHSKQMPNNSKFYTTWYKSILSNKPIKKVLISVTPKGFTYDQEIAEWLTNFEEINFICGRYEGFDSRVEDLVDLEISLGDFVINGGEVASMVIMESIIRLLPGFTKNIQSIRHDSFSPSVNKHDEQIEYVIGKKKLAHLEDISSLISSQIFNDQDWINNKAPFVEHPQYTRPEVWNNKKVPNVLISGHHKNIQNWRENWFK